MSVATARNQEPTMEDILASIRKIISDDLEASVARPSDDASANGADVYDLADQMAFHAQKESALLSPLGVSDDRAECAQTAPEAQHIATDPVAIVTELAARMRSAVEAALPEQRTRPAPATAEPPAVPEKSLSLSRNVQSSVASALEALRQTPVAPPLPKPETTNAVLRSLVESALQPVLARWLDAHLPGIVERLVKAEIEKISRER